MLIPNNSLASNAFYSETHVYCIYSLLQSKPVPLYPEKQVQLWYPIVLLQ